MKKIHSFCLLNLSKESLYHKHRSGKIDPLWHHKGPIRWLSGDGPWPSAPLSEHVEGATKPLLFQQQAANKGLNMLSQGDRESMLGEPCPYEEEQIPLPGWGGSPARRGRFPYQEEHVPAGVYIYIKKKTQQKERGLLPLSETEHNGQH